VTLVHASREQTVDAARSRAAWPLIVVVVVASAIGVVVAMLSMPDDAIAPPVSNPRSASVAPSVVETAASPVSPPAPDTPPPLEAPPPVAVTPQAADTPPQASNPTPQPSDTPIPLPAAAPASKPAVDAPSTAEAGPPRPSPTAVPASKAVDAANATEAARTRTPARGTAATPATLNALIRKGDYATAFRACSSTTVTAEIASACVYAACYRRAMAKARSWLTVFAGPKQKLATQCEKYSGLKLDP
jgi:outer membrane biosynthesis protein TonB